MDNNIVNVVKEWIELDADIKELQKIIKSKRLQKKLLTSELVKTMKQNDIDCFDVNNGSLVYTRNKVKSSISKKILLTSLAEFFGANNENVQKISNLILDRRNETIIESIRMNKDK